MVLKAFGDAMKMPAIQHAEQFSNENGSETKGHGAWAGAGVGVGAGVWQNRQIIGFIFDEECYSNVSLP